MFKCPILDQNFLGKPVRSLQYSYNDHTTIPLQQSVATHPIDIACSRESVERRRKPPVKLNRLELGHRRLHLEGIRGAGDGGGRREPVACARHESRLEGIWTGE